jgi:hypothetical protein
LTEDFTYSLFIYIIGGYTILEHNMNKCSLYFIQDGNIPEQPRNIYASSQLISSPKFHSFGIPRRKIIGTLIISCDSSKTAKIAATETYFKEE